MGSIAEEFANPDRDNHTRMKGAIETAITADFKVEEAAKHKSNVKFSKKPLEFFVREKIDPSSYVKTPPDAAPRAAVSEPTETPPPPEDAQTIAEPIHANVPSQESDLEDLSQVLAEDTVQIGDIEPQPETSKPTAVPEEPKDEQQSEYYDEGFAAGRAAALSELEEQRLDYLEVLKSISEKLLTDSVFDFENISKKVLETVYELSSERCGLAIDENPEAFLNRIAAQIEQVRNLSEERSVFFNEEDLEALKSFGEFENYFSKAQVRSDPKLKRGDVVVKVGGVELRDAPFYDYEQDVRYE